MVEGVVAGRLNAQWVAIKRWWAAKLSSGLPDKSNGVRSCTVQYKVLLCMCPSDLPTWYQQSPSIGRSARRPLRRAGDHHQRGSEIASLSVVSSGLQPAETFVAVGGLLDIIDPPHHHITSLPPGCQLIFLSSEQ
jgi:hypothetical protein